MLKHIPIGLSKSVLIVTKTCLAGRNFRGLNLQKRCTRSGPQSSGQGEKEGAQMPPQGSVIIVSTSKS